MTTETVVVRETARLVEREPRSSFSHKVRETALLHGEGRVTPFANVREVAHLDDTVRPSAFSLLHEKVHISDTVTPELTYAVTTRDLFRADDLISGWRTAHQTVRETALLHGRAVAPPTASLHERFFVSSGVAGGGTSVVVLHERARLNDRAYTSNSVRVRDVAFLDDAISSHLRANVDVREVALLDDDVAPRFVSRAGLHEVFQIDDVITRSVIWSGGATKLREVFYVDDRAAPPANGRAYTCSILTWGMSEYQNYPFQTQAGGYAAGQNLWRLDALDDYGSPINSWILTGKADIGTSHGKRPSGLYAAGSSSEPLAVVVTGDVGGALASYDYVLDLRDQTNYRNNRALLGKGFRSRYLQFKIEAPKYLGFRLLNAEVDVAVSPRRVG